MPDQCGTVSSGRTFCQIGSFEEVIEDLDDGDLGAHFPVRGASLDGAVVQGVDLFLVTLLGLFLDRDSPRWRCSFRDYFLHGINRPSKVGPNSKY